VCYAKSTSNGGKKKYWISLVDETIVLIIQLLEKPLAKL
jgi:hypothetical protein